jgi:hypothetical protein
MKDYKIKYNLPDYSHIECMVFGSCDGTDGSCHYCQEETPYQFEMCSDYCWKRNLISSLSKIPNCSEEEAINFINNYKRKRYGL